MFVELVQSDDSQVIEGLAMHAYRLQGRKLVGPLNAAAVNDSRTEEGDETKELRVLAQSWVAEGFTVWLMRRRPPVRGFSSPDGTWTVVEEFRPPTVDHQALGDRRISDEPDG